MKSIREFARYGSVSGIDLEKTVAYLKEYHGEKYVAPENTSGAKKEYYSVFKERGQAAREEFAKFCKEVCKKVPGLEMDSASPSMWKNQGQLVNEYFWSRFKTQEYNGFVNNISIAINKQPSLNDSWVLGVYVGAIFTKAGGEECLRQNRQNRLLDLDIPESDGLYYSVKPSNGENYLIKDRDELRKRYDAVKVTIVELLKVIPGPYTEDRVNELIEDTKAAILEFLPYYEYVQSGERPERPWKGVKPEASKPVVPSIDWEAEYPVGCRVEHPRFGEGTVQEIGETNVLISFDDFGEKKLGKEVCEKEQLLTRI